MDLQDLLKQRILKEANPSSNSVSVMNMGSKGPQSYSYSYLSFNSLYKNTSVTQGNRLSFAIIEKAESTNSITGVSKYPSQIVKMVISPINMSRKFIVQDDTVDDLKFGKLFIGVEEYNQESYSSHDSFRYHFAFNVSENPNDQTQLIANPINDTYIFTNPIRFDGALSFNFFTTKPYQFEEDTYQCYIDYSQPFMTFYKTDGSQHNLSNIDIVYMDNFMVPGIVQLNNSIAPTNKSKLYRISIVDLYRFEIQLQLPNQIVTSINRPADPSLGVYMPPITVNVTFGNPTLLTSPIQNGLSNGDIITVTGASRNDLFPIIKSWPVTVINSTQFTIGYDSSALIGQGQIIIQSFPISTDRQNVIFIKIVTKKTDFTLEIASKSETATNDLINIAL